MENKGKKILILGNGFDLAHSLPTKYSDFLNFCQMIELIWKYPPHSESAYRFKEGLSEWKTVKSVRSEVEKAFDNRRIDKAEDGTCTVTSDNKELTEIHKMLDDNIWYQYFMELYRKKRMKGENWIDFESEIRFVIEEIDRKALSLTDLWDDVAKRTGTKLEDFNKLVKNIKWHSINTVKDFRKVAFEDLKRLTKALEWYLSAFVEKIEISKKVPEILNLKPDYVISFNYTNTYEKIYNKNNKAKVYYIHGKSDAKLPEKADINPTDDNNMVLGIDEYWSSKKRNKQTNFTIFKKFAQRIQKRTGNDSFKYLNEIRKAFQEKGNFHSGNVDITTDHPDGVSYVYVFGHSLDITDKDILSNFIGDEATAVTIFCFDEAAEGELIANTIKLIGERKLLNKTNHVPPKLEYVLQKNEEGSLS